MFTYNEEILSILKPRVEDLMLTGYYGGMFNAEKYKFVAATIVDLKSVDYWHYEYLHGQLNGHAISHYNFERSKKFVTEDSFQYKTSQECIAEGIYKYFSITFVGVYYERKWYVLQSLNFYGEYIDEIGIKKHLEERIDDGYFTRDVFEPMQPHHTSIDGKIVTYRNVEHEEFANAPYLVSLLKQQQKEKVNHAYCAYFNQEIVLPFFEYLRINEPNQYVKFHELRANFISIFPEHKKYTIFCASVLNAKQELHLNYFVYLVQERAIYKWTYFEPSKLQQYEFYGDAIINDLQKISNWNHIDFLDSSCTLDDQAFWDNYVIAKANDQYLYLEKLLSL